MSSRGKAGSSGRRKMRSAAVAGTVGAKSRRRPPPKNNSKPLLIGLAALLLISAIVAIAVVFSGGSTDFEVSQEQFSGDIQLEDSDEELIEWDDELGDLNSPKAMALVAKIKPQLTSAMESEGFSLDDVQITSLTPDEPKDITRIEQVDSSTSSEGRIWGRSRNWNKYQQITYKNIRPVNIKYKTFGKPSKNAAVMGSVHTADTWKKVGSAISTRMRSTGYRTTVKSIEPQEDFVNSVYKEIQASPQAITTVSPPKMDVRKITKCNPMNSVENIDNSENDIFECTTTCKEDPRSVFIYGGHEDIFNSFTRTCTAAYAAGFINDDAKGMFQVIPQGIAYSKNRTESEPIQGDWITVVEDPWLSTLFKIKSVGSVITPTEPPPPPRLDDERFAPLFSDPVNIWATETKVDTPSSEIGNDNTMMVIYMDVYVPIWPKKQAEPAAYYRGDSADAETYRKDVVGTILLQLKNFGFQSVKYEGFFPSYGTEGRMALYLTINDDETTFVQTIAKLNGLRFQGFAKQMMHDMELNQKRHLGSLRLTKKGKEVLEKAG